ncbi:hypothetical protein TWF730_001540 [Orbilia blumenaviensis]|uniref:F-box domain-containing protein n=1 Tax=Orbilia blumenaviensis TaxID=1796055 RepID=A0AAV9UI18_9PEZI
MPLLSLPVELLSYIIKYALDNDHQFEDAARLNIVCQHFRALTMQHLYMKCHLRLYQDPQYNTEGTFGHIAWFKRFNDHPMHGIETAKHKFEMFKKYGGYVKHLTIHSCELLAESALTRADFSYPVLEGTGIPMITNPLLSAFTNLTGFKIFTGIRRNMAIKSHETVAVINDVLELCPKLKHFTLGLDIDESAPYQLKRIVNEMGTKPPSGKKAALASIRFLTLGFSISTRDSKNRYSEATAIWPLTWFSLAASSFENVERFMFTYTEYVKPSHGGTSIKSVPKNKINKLGYRIHLPKVKELDIPVLPLSMRVLDEYFVINKETIKSLRLDIFRFAGLTREGIYAIISRYPNLEAISLLGSNIGSSSNRIGWSIVPDLKRLFRGIKALVLYTEQSKKEMEEAIGEDFLKSSCVRILYEQTPTGLDTRSGGKFTAVIIYP